MEGEVRTRGGSERREWRVPGRGAPLNSEVRDAVAVVTVVQCEASNLAELARAREKAVLELEELGLHLPQLIGGAGAATAACMT